MALSFAACTCVLYAVRTRFAFNIWQAKYFATWRESNPRFAHGMQTSHAYHNPAFATHENELEIRNVRRADIS